MKQRTSIEHKIQSKGFQSDEEKTYVNAIYTGMLLFKQITSFMSQFELSEPQYNVMRILRGSYPEPLYSSDIQRRMLHQNSNSTRLIEKLIDKGFVIIKNDPSDKRLRLNYITDAGLEYLNYMDPFIIEHCKEVVNLSEIQMKTINLLMDQLNADKDNK